jgi:hypothetical protein
MSAQGNVALGDEMIERAAAVLRDDAGEAGIAHTDCRDLAEEMLRAAFDGVPLVNYGIGQALQFFDLVICVKDREHSPAAGVYRANGKPHEFDVVPHYLEVSWQHKPTRYIKRVAVSKLDPPEIAR